MSWRAGYVGLIGQPNSGKSTLLNALVGDQVAIVTPKPQTTRQRLIGIVNHEQTQVCLVDAPGLIQASRGINHYLEREVRDVASQSDVLLAVLSVDEERPENLEQVLKLVKESHKPWLAVITKTDLPFDHRISVIRTMVIQAGGTCLSLSAHADKGQSLIERLIPELAPFLPESPQPLFPLDVYTTQNVREMASELIREQGFLELHQEVPFGLAVRVRRFEERGKDVRIAADLVVTRENHRPIVIGRGGQKLKAIGSKARGRIADLVGQPVHLDLQVVVKRNWHQDQKQMAELGYVVSDN